MLLGISLIGFAIFADVIAAPNVTKNKRRVCMTEDCKAFARSIITSMDSSIDPCVDFYEYACGNWPKGHPIPPGKNAWKFIAVAAEENKRRIEELLNQDSRKNEIPPFKIVKKWYKACIDTADMERRGMGPFVSILSKIGGWPIIMAPNKWNKNAHKWQTIDDYYARLTGKNLFHETRVAVYDSDSTELWAVLDVPDMPLATWLLNSEVIEEENGNSEEESTGTDEGEQILNSTKKFDKKGRYWKFIVSVITAMAEATGFNISKDKLERDIEELLNFQWKLDKLTYMSDSKTNMTMENFQKWYDNFVPSTENAKVNWIDKIINIFKDAKLELDVGTNLKVASPKYFKNLASLLKQTSSRTIVNYLHWSFISHRISKTTQAMRKLFQSTNTASDEEEDGQPTRSEQCIEEAKMEDIIAHAYIKKYFSNNTLKLALNVVDDIQKQIEIEIQQSNWADNKIKKFALQKLRTIQKNVAYPDWYNNATTMNHYLDELTIGSTYFENALALDRYHTLKELKPLKYKDGVKSWIVDPLTINAFYLNEGNSITVPAANLQKPFFSVAQPNTVNYGLIGYLLAHEMYHAFDQQRHIYNEKFEEIEWSRNMTGKYNKNVQCFVKQFNNYTLDGTPSGARINDYGNQTLEENMSDTMGLQSAFKAYKSREKIDGKPNEALPGLEAITNDQLFFLSFTNLWCENVKPDLLAKLSVLDVHSTGRLRTIGSLSNTAEFAKAFNCPLGSPMNPEKKCNIWKH